MERGYFINFKIQRRDQFEDLSIRIGLDNNIWQPGLEIKSEYPYRMFQLYRDGELLLNAKVYTFLQLFQFNEQQDFIDFEVLYIGQSYGVDGARTAPDRLISHSTLQGIYAEAMDKNPDSEIWLALASFDQFNLMMFDGRSSFTDEERESDKERFSTAYDKLNWDGGISDQQKINFTEAALIRYFKPPYNQIYKDSFPNPAHSTYTECYDLDINSVCIELNTGDIVNCRFYSEAVPKVNWHMKDFALHSKEERRAMFDISDY